MHTKQQCTNHHEYSHQHFVHHGPVCVRLGGYYSRDTGIYSDLNNVDRDIDKLELYGNRQCVSLCVRQCDVSIPFSANRGLGSGYHEGQGCRRKDEHAGQGHHGHRDWLDGWRLRRQHRCYP